jgi:hypothetical protein
MDQFAGIAAAEVSRLSGRPLSCANVVCCAVSEVAARLVGVRSMGHSGRDLLTLSFSHFDRYGHPEIWRRVPVLHYVR